MNAAYERQLSRDEQHHANDYGEIWNPDTDSWEDWLAGLGAYPDDDLGDDPDAYADMLTDDALGVTR